MSSDVVKVTGRRLALTLDLPDPDKDFFFELANLLAKYDVKTQHMRCWTPEPQVEQECPKCGKRRKTCVQDRVIATFPLRESNGRLFVDSSEGRVDYNYDISIAHRYCEYCGAKLWDGK